MTKTWRERCAEARERGHFNDEDWRAWSSLSTCPAGETVQGLGFPMNGNIYKTFLDCWCLGNGLYNVMIKNDFAGAESLLDEIEDTALEIKRGL